MNVLITGSAGFIGYHLTKSLLSTGISVVGLDNLNNYYDPQLKYDRLKELNISVNGNTGYNEALSSSTSEKFKFIKLDLQDRVNLPMLFKKEKFDLVINLAAQAGVRYSLENPEAYIDSNIVGFLNVLECCKHNKVKKIIYASSSSVYGQNSKTPFSVEDRVDHPISLYAATKKSNELMAATYSHLYNIQTIGLRFFTVYGPWGRPDMAMFLFTDAISKNEYIKVFNNGNLERDFTYIDDIIEGIMLIVKSRTEPRNLYSLYNIGNSKPVKLLDFINEIENQLGITAKKEMLPMQAGDVNQTWADVDSLKRDFHYKPKTSVKTGVREFIKWYKNYYK